MTLTTCTGYEVAGKCYWCGGGLKTKRRSYCCDEHRQEYYRHFEWSTASKWCLRRNDKCQICGIDRRDIPLVGEEGMYGGTSGFRVHHIIPVNGGSRYFNLLNAPCNLMALCHSCHVKIHKLDTLRSKEGAK